MACHHALRYKLLIKKKKSAVTARDLWKYTTRVNTNVCMLLLPGTFRLSLTTISRSCPEIQQNCYYSTRSSAHSIPPSKSHSSRRIRHLNGATPVVLAENRCAEVTTWDLLKNMAEAFALIRAVEQKYGPVESFTFRKVRYLLNPPAESLSKHV